jgi:transposase
MVLGCASGKLNGDVAKELKTTIQTVGKWRARFVELRLDGLADVPGPNIHRKLADDRVEELVRTTLQSKPDGATH